MARGKYAARAANVLAHTENDLLKAEIARREAAEASRDQVLLELSAIKTKFASAVLVEAAAQAKPTIDQAAAQIAIERRAHEAEVERLFLGVGATVFHKGSRIAAPNLMIAKLAELFGMPERAGELVVNVGPGFRRRDYVRRDAKVFRRIAEYFGEPDAYRHMERSSTAPEPVDIAGVTDTQEGDGHVQEA